LNHRNIDAKFTLLSKSGSNADADRQGVRAELHGGKYPFNAGGRDQMAVIEFVCDPERTGLEGDDKDEGDGLPDDNDDDNKDKDDGEKEERRWDLGKREQGGKGQCEDSDASLRFCGYGPEDDEKTKVDVLRLEWRTKYACKDAPADSNGGWGFFTWFIIM
jgi:autophagy-related protein 27